MLTECGNLPTPELLEKIRHEFGLEQPFLVQYINGFMYLGHIVEVIPGGEVGKK